MTEVIEAGQGLLGIKALEDGVSIVLSKPGERWSAVEKLGLGEVYFVQISSCRTVKVSGKTQIYSPYGEILSEQK